MWSCIRNGSSVEIRADSGEIIALVGNHADPRINARLANAKIMALSPEMLDVLIDIQELVRRECFEAEHPLAELIKTKVNAIINKSFQQRSSEHEKKVFRKTRTDGGYFRPQIIRDADLRTEIPQEGTELFGGGEIFPQDEGQSGSEPGIYEERRDTGSGDVV